MEELLSLRGETQFKKHISSHRNWLTNEAETFTKFEPEIKPKRNQAREMAFWLNWTTHRGLIVLYKLPRFPLVKIL